MDAVLVSSLSLSAASALVFAAVGASFLRRSVSARMRVGRDAFALWWFGLAAVELLGAGMTLLAATRSISIPTFLVLEAIALLILCVALWGLLVYLIFLYADTSRPAWLIGVAYAALFLWLCYLTFSQPPTSISVNGWSVQPEPAPSAGIQVAAGLLIILPIVAGAFAYLAMYFRVEERLQKRRILLVSVSLLAWFGSSGVALLPSIGTSAWWQVLSRLIALVASGVIYYAYVALKPGAGEPVPAVQRGSPPPSQVGPRRPETRGGGHALA